MEKIWYYTIDGERHGPVSASDLKELASKGTLKPDDLIWKEGLEEWISAKKLKGLFAESQTPSTPGAKPTEEAPPKPKPETDSPENDGTNLNLSGRPKQGGSPSRRSRTRDDDRDDRDNRDNRRPSRTSRRDDYDDDPDWDRRASRRDRSDRDYRDDYHTQKDDYDDLPRRRGDGKNPTLGIISMICGILSIVLVPIGFFGVCCFFFFFVNAVPMIPALVAIVLGLIGMNKSNKGMSLAGVITGVIGLILSAGMLVLSLVYPAMMMAVPPPPPAAPVGGGGWNAPAPNPPIQKPPVKKIPGGWDD